MQKEKEDQLKHLADRVLSFRHKRKAIDRTISEYTSEPVDDLLKYFPSTPLTKPFVIENDYRGVGDRDESDAYEPSGKSRLQPVSIENPPDDYGNVARQMVAPHSRPKVKGVTFSGGVVDDRGGGTTWAGTATNLKRSASTNDLQTQIRKITVSASTQYESIDHDREWANGLEDATSKRRPITSMHDNRLVLADAEISYKKDRYQKTSDVQAQIRGITKNSGVQVGVRVVPKAIDLTQVEIGNLGLEVQDNREAAGLGLRVGQVLCPVTIGTAMDLYEGPGIQVLGINDVDSLNLELRNSIAHATTDVHKRLKVRDVQAQIFTKSDSTLHSEFWDNLVQKQPVSETQLNEAQFHQKTASVQAVAAMEVVNISSNEPKKNVAEGSVASFCLLPENQPKEVGHFNCEPTTSAVMSQISCLLHSRGIHSDLQTYLSDYKQRHGIATETSDLCTQINIISKDSNVNTDEMGNRSSEPQRQVSSNVADGIIQPVKAEGTASFKTEAWASTTVDNRAAQEYPDSQDAQTLIRNVVNNAETQVSSKLIPTEVTVSKIKTTNMEISFINQLQEANIAFPVDSLVCPADMKFRSELYEGSELAMADYNDLGNILVTHSDSVARGSFKLEPTSQKSEDVQTQIISDLKTPAAVVLRTGEVDRTKRELLVGEATTGSKYVPRLKLVVTDVTATPQQQVNPQCDLQTQISSMSGPKGTDDSIISETELVEGGSSVARKNLTTESGYSTQKDTNVEISENRVSVKDASEQTFPIVSETICAKCGQKYCDLQNQLNANTKNEPNHRSVSQTREGSVIADVSAQVVEEAFATTPRPKPQVGAVDASMQVAVELVPIEIKMSHCDIEDMQLEFEEVDNQVSSSEVYKMRMKSVTCPARLKVKTRLTEGSGVHVVGIQDTRQIGFSVSSTPTRFVEGNVACVGGAVDDEFQSLVAFEHPIKTGTVAARSRNSSRSTQRSLIRLIPCEIDSKATRNTHTDSQSFKITATAFTQVGTQLIPQAIGISPVSLENMEVSVASKETGVQEQSLSASAILYPAEIELVSKLTDDRSGFEIVSLAQVEALQLNTSEEETHLRYRHASLTNVNGPHPSADLQTQVGPTDTTKDKPHVLPASIVMKTKQFDGSSRAPELVTQSFVGSLLSDARGCKALTLRAVAATRMGRSDNGVALVNQAAYLTKEQSTQAVSSETPKIGQEVYLPLQKPAASALRKSEGVQVGMKMVAKSLEVSQIPVGNLQLESTTGLSEQNVSYTFDSLRCPAKITLQTELCEESGIQVCSLDQAKEIDVGLVNESTHSPISPRISSKEHSTRQRSLKAGWWSSIISGRTPPVESKSMQNAVVKLPSQGIQVSSKELLSKECNLILEAEASLIPSSLVSSTETRVPTSSSAKQQFKLVMTNTNNQATNKKTTMQTLEGPSARDCEIQVGIKLIPNSVEVKSIKMENMEVEMADTKSVNVLKADVSAILCSSGIKYDEVLVESPGIQLVDINDTDEVEINYNKATYNAQVISNAKRQINEEIVSSVGSKSREGKVWNTVPQMSQSTYSDGTREVKTNETTTQFETRLRVRHEEYTTEQSLRSGMWSDRNRASMVDGVAQVGLNLVPRIVEVNSIAVENLDAVRESRDQGTCDQVGVSAMLCTTATEYDEVLTESRGVNVVPINKAQEMQITHGGNAYYTTVETQKRVPTLGYYSGHRNQVPDVESRETRLRVHHAEYSAEGDHQIRATHYDNGRSVERVDGGTQVGAVFVPTELTMQRMSLDTQQIPGLSRSVSEKSVLCPVGMNISTVLTDGSGVQIADVKNTSEISVQMHQDKYAADITTDSATNQARISLKEKSISMTRQPLSAHISLVDPTARRSDTSYTSQVERSGRTFGSATTRLNSRSVQVGTLLVPTTITMEKVNVENLEIEVPLSPGRHAGVNVSAVLASSATEMTAVLTNASGIQVVPMKNAGEIGIQMGGKTYVGSVDASPSDRAAGTSHTSGVLKDGNVELKRDMQHIVLPLRMESGTSQASAYAEGLLRQSTDLSRLHDVLRSREATPSLRVTTSTSSNLHSRPGLLRMSGDLITPVTESMVESSLPPAKEMRDSEVQVGLKLVPQTLDVEHVRMENMNLVYKPTSGYEQESNAGRLIIASGLHYDPVLSDTVGVQVEPIQSADVVRIRDGSNVFHATVVSDRNLTHCKETSIGQSNRYLTSVSGTPHTSMEGETTLHICHIESACDGKPLLINATTNRDIPNRSAVFSSAAENWINSSCQYCGRRKVETKIKDSTDLFTGSSSASLKIPCLQSDASVQVGIQIMPKSIKLDSVAVENLLLEVKDEEMAANLEFPVGAIFYPSEIEAEAALNECGGIEMQEVDTIREVVIEHGGERKVADVYFSPPKKLVGSFESINSERQELAQVSRKQQQTTVNRKTLSLKTATIILPKSQPETSDSIFKTGPMTIRSSSQKPRILLSGRRKQVMRVRTEVSTEPTGAAESRIFTCPCGRLYSSTDGKNRPLNVSCNACGASGVVVVEGAESISQEAVEPMYTLIQRPKLEETKSADWYNVACEAKIQPEMFSKRLTAKIFASSAEIGTQFYGSVQNADDVPNETIVLLESKTDSPYRQITSETTYHPLTQGTTINRVKSTGNLTVQQTNMVHMSTQCTITHRDSLAAVSAIKINAAAGFHQSRSPYTDDMTSITLEGASKDETFGKTQRRTHSADSQAQKKTARICAKCQNKVNNTETNASESVTQTLTIQRGSTENVAGISESTSASRTSALRRNFFSGSTHTRSSEFIDTIGSHTDADRCAMCRAELTSGDLTTSILSSTSSLAGFEPMTNVETKEIAEAFTQVNRTTADVGSFVKGRHHLSLYQSLKENRIIQAVIRDYEVEKGRASGQLSVEAKELADIMAPTSRQTALTSSQPPAYNELRHNMLARKVVESYEASRRIQRRDDFVQTDESHLSERNPTDYTRSLSTGSQAQNAAKQIIEVVSTFARRESQVSAKKSLYVTLRANPIIHQVIRDYEKDKCEQKYPLISPSEAEEIAEVVANAHLLAQTDQRSVTDKSLYANLENTQLIRKVIAHHKSERQETLKEALVQTEIPLTASIKTPIQSLDGQVAILEAEQFVSATTSSHGGSSVARRVKKRRPINAPLSSSISSDSSGDEVVEVSSRPRWSPLHTSESTKYDVACSALITPEVWDKRIQADTMTDKR
ncbi:unnamed protein product [Mesocestoides corti]|uniref:PDZ domain-containing protein n=1 Tax=Mesocestoides corti TaxID=53468 RepID=A0A0R3U512_MESCO|nr:unnamed protein product [Mesocestoides corti]